jgi:2-methylisocitrate lyase-like PEP mutase family enzyme
MANPDLRLKLQSKTFITAPGVFDLVSAKLADRTAAEAIYISGFAVVASYLGLPDAGIADYSQMLDRAAAIPGAVRKPIIADGDTGYGGLLNVHHTVRGYEKAGVSMIQLEDQKMPKKCGHEPRRHIVSTEEMVNKIKVASDARSSKDFLILARTDARTSYGIDEAIRRGEAYARAGADAIFIESPESIEEMKRIGAQLDVPLVSNQLHGGKTPILPEAQLRDMGFAAAIYPTAALFVAAKAVEGVYDDLAHGRLVSAPLETFENFTGMIGFGDIFDFEDRFADAVKLETGD